jgi:Ran GTPase-activating protein (RanGAP) involved in mRNA processing and transport
LNCVAGAILQCGKLTTIELTFEERSFESFKADQIRFDMKSIADAFSKNHSITQFRLENANIGDDGAALLAQALLVSKDPHPLIELKLCRCEITDEGVAEICKALPSTSVCTLDLSFNKFGHEGFKYLAGKLSGGKTKLKSLRMQGNLTCEECEKG